MLRSRLGGYDGRHHGRITTQSCRAAAHGAAAARLQRRQAAENVAYSGPTAANETRPKQASRAVPAEPSRRPRATSRTAAPKCLATALLRHQSCLDSLSRRLGAVTQIWKKGVAHV